MQIVDYVGGASNEHLLGSDQNVPNPFTHICADESVPLLHQHKITTDPTLFMTCPKNDKICRFGRTVPGQVGHCRL